MNEERLLIEIGANTDAFEIAAKQLILLSEQTQGKITKKTYAMMKKLGKELLAMQDKDAKELLSLKIKYNNLLQTEENKNIRENKAAEEKASKEIAADKSKYNDFLQAEEKRNLKELQAERERIEKEILTAKRQYNNMLQAEEKKKAKELSDINKKAAEYDYAERKRVLKREKALVDKYHKDRIKNIKYLASLKGDLNRKEYAAELRRIRNLSHVERRAETQRANRVISNGQGKQDATMGRGFIDSVKVVAKYGAISQALFGLQSAFRAVAAEMIRFDQSIYTNMAVLGVTAKEALKLAKTVDVLSVSYGTAAEEIHGAMITLGRAGVDGTRELQQATKVLSELALITGDSMADGAAGIATMLSVYPLLRQEIDVLGESLATVANATRLGLKDFTTISNYALTTAKSIGLSADAYLSLAGAMSLVGLNASTIGTSIRRLKKFTDSSSEAMKVFFRYLGITQKEFRGLLSDSKTSTQALVSLSTQLAKLSDNKKEYTAATRKMNIQEKATADALALIGKSDSLLRMLVQVKSAAAETGKLEAQAKKMAQGLDRAFKSVGFAISQAFNEQFINIMETMFDREGDAQSFQNSIDNLAKSVIFLMKQLPIVALGFTGVAIKSALATNSILTFGSASAALVGKIKTLTKAMYAFIKTPFGLAIAGVTTVLTVLNAVTTISADLQRDYNNVLENGVDAFKVLGKEARKQTLALYNKNVVEVTKNIKDMSDELERGGKLSQRSGAIYKNSAKEIDALKLKLEKAKKGLVLLKNSIIGLADVQARFKDEKLGYIPTPADVALMEETVLLSQSTLSAVTEQEMAYNKLVYAQQASNTELLAISKLHDEEAEQIKAAHKNAQANYKVKQAGLAIDRKLTESSIKLSEAQAKNEIAQGNQTKLKAEEVALKEQLVILETEHAKSAQRIAVYSVNATEEIKKTVKYKLALTKAQEDEVRVLEKRAELLDNAQKQLIQFRDVALEVYKAFTDANTAMKDINDSIADAARQYEVLSGRMTPQSASVASATTSNDNAVKALEVAEDTLAILQSTGALTGQALIDHNKEVLLAEQLVDQKAKAMTLAGIALESAYKNEKISDRVTQHQREQLDLREASQNAARGLAKHERKIEGSLAKQKELRLAIKQAKENFDKIPSTDNENTLREARLALNDEIIRQENIILDVKDKSAANARAALKLETDALAVKQVQTQIDIVNQEIMYAKLGIEMSSYTVQQNKIALATIEAKLNKKAYLDAVKKYGVDNKNLILKKKVLQLELKAAKSEKKKIKEIKKYTDELKKQMKSVGSSFADNLLSGDIKGAFESLAKDIMDVFLTPIKEQFSNLFGDVMTALFDEFYNMVVAKSAASVAPVVADNTTKAASGGTVALVNALKDGDWYTSFARMAATAAVLAGLGVMVGGAGGGAGGSASSVPSPTPQGGYNAVQGGTYANGGIVDYAGNSISMEQYNEIVKIATINQTDFNEAVKVYNDLTEEAHEIWTKASTTFRKFNALVGEYGDAVNAVKSGTIDSMNDFFDNFASQGEKLDFAKRQAEFLYNSMGQELPASLEEAKAGVMLLIASLEGVTDPAIRAAIMIQIGKQSEAANSMYEWHDAAKDAAESQKDAAEALEEAARQLRLSVASLKTEWMPTLEGSKLYLDVVRKETGLYDVSYENFLRKFTEASNASDFSEDQFEDWSEISSALQNYNDALEEKLQLEQEKLQLELDALNEELAFYKNIKQLIDTAYTGALSYLNTMEKAEYAGQQALVSLEGGDTQGYIAGLSKQLDYEKKMSTSRENYLLLFEDYTNELRQQEPEKTLDDVVDSIEATNEKLDDLHDAISKSSYQKA